VGKRKGAKKRWKSPYLTSKCHGKKLGGAGIKSGTLRRTALLSFGEQVKAGRRKKQREKGGRICKQATGCVKEERPRDWSARDIDGRGRGLKAEGNIDREKKMKRENGGLRFF